MSEPMSSVEIEDVLSSIRRLVSDDLRPQSRVLREQQSAAPAAPTEKLVLTPALRIVAEPEGPAEAAPEAQTEPDTDDPAMFHTIRAPAVEEAGFIEVEDLDEAPAPLRDFGARVDAMPAEVGDYDDDGAAAPVEEAVSIPEEVFAAAEAVADEGTSNWADEAEAAVLAELEQETVNSAFAAQFVDDEEEPAFDEASMRELVRDIIREELQGTLGERITRNVRKLVRAEIARALAVRDFE